MSSNLAAGKVIDGGSYARSDRVQTLVFLMLVFTGQATIYLVREHHHLWSSMPSRWMLVETIADIGVVTVLATSGILMAPISWADAAGLLAAVVLATLVLDTAKVWVLTRWCPVLIPTREPTTQQGPRTG